MLKHKSCVALFIPLGIIAFVLAMLNVISLYWTFGILTLWLGVTSWGAFDVRLSYFVDIFYRKVRHDNKSISLTFDDGPTAFTNEFLDLLKSHNAKATFFCIGIQIEKHPDIIKRILEEGHSIGNHTMHHFNSFGFLNTKQIVQEINSFDRELVEFIPLKTKLFRPPFGVTNPSVAKAVKETKHQVIGWNNRSLDTVLEDEIKIFERVRSKLHPGDIILMHDTSLKTLKALEMILVYMDEHNLQSVTVGKLLNLQVYDS